MFKPEEIIFAPTADCNLACPHCRVTRIPDRLEARDAVAFMKSCRSAGLERVGFSGGEPFLRPDFLNEVSRAAVEMDMLFGRLMTNGVWFDSPDHLRRTLTGLREAGFDGKFGVSIDAYHDQDIRDLTLFFETVFSVWGRRDGCEIVTVIPPDGAEPRETFERLAERFDGRLIIDEGIPYSIVNDAFMNPRETADGPFEALAIDIIRVPYSAPAEENAWTAEHWFEDDFCRGPGNVFYVHPDGAVAVCCGFANENGGLIIGRIPADGYRQLLRRAQASPVVRACFDTGLATIRELLEAQGSSFPGKTEDRCFFCDYLAKHDFPIPKQRNR
ncbi:MAG TPA: radical SAM protein [Candidatus Aminicenantes bacterium]|nr:radical SAM protein [Acidobacteriota bacterium]HNQ79632.1 radical SAM protein [Candidatus Aminicenantes bacterium]HOY99850.1 radical SAM protein [Candidatus Aminicenantes bacterium]